MNIRGSGLLLHITSLHTRFGIGDLGPSTYEFLSFLSKSGQRYWQILPVYPTDPQYDNSPYHALSTFAGNPLLISPELLVTQGFLEDSNLYPIPEFPSSKVDFAAVITYKEQLFTLAYNRFSKNPESAEFISFCQENAGWLDDYSLFMVLRRQYAPVLWGDWPDEYKRRDPETLRRYRNENQEAIRKEQFIQYLFAIQWKSLRLACHQQNIWLIGDIPIYVDYDSADLWTHPELFQLDNELKPFVISGVPPDYFSETGQVWDNPIYDWKRMEETGFAWWIQRVAFILSRVDYLRIDHFRGLVEFWEIPAGSETAVNGIWSLAPAYKFLKSLGRSFSTLPIIAEDLGIITPDVREMMREFSLPGMKVLLFAFGYDMPENPYILHNHVKDCVVYTGTHDNNPILGWYEDEASPENKKNISQYVGRTVASYTINDTLIRMAMMSVANTVIIPVQDILRLDGTSRMNKPGVNIGNWVWKLSESQMPEEISQKLLAMTKLYGRD